MMDRKFCCKMCIKIQYSLALKFCRDKLKKSKKIQHPPYMFFTNLLESQVFFLHLIVVVLSCRDIADLLATILRYHRRSLQ